MAQKTSPNVYRCGNCDGEFNSPIENRNRDGIESHHCPFCDATLSDRFTKQKNVEECAHSATVDGGRGNVNEVCSECGAKFSRKGVVGIKDAWNAQGGRL